MRQRLAHAEVDAVQVGRQLRHAAVHLLEVAVQIPAYVYAGEIYGGMGSTFDYGHYGVLMKNNIRERWFEAMVRNREACPGSITARARSP